MSTVDVEARTQQLGRALLAAAERYRPGPAERVQDWLLTHAVADDRFRSRLLRYLDVLASVDYDSSGAEAKRLAHEYFGDEFPELPRALRWFLRIARNDLVPARIVGESARRSAERFARRFITRPGAGTVRATTALLANHGRVPSFDLLGEAVLSDPEAKQYLARYLELIGQLGDDPLAGSFTAGDVFALQVSLKLSSLTAHFSPVDPEGTIARVRPALEAIVEAADGAGVGITVDMEQYAYRDLTWELFRRTFARGERFGGWPGAGIVLQAYLRSAEEDAAALVAFAGERRVPFQVRLVKGAYWDYETIVADAGRWAPPVFVEKSATDSAFERALAQLIDAHPAVHLAVGSHNARAHARAEALAEAAGLPPNTVEHQTLFRTAEGTSRALAEVGWVARDYVPVGELLPGMAYLVRRVLENSSQAGVLLQSRAGAAPEELLRPPPAREPSLATPPRDAAAFRRAPEARWFEAEFRDAFEAALASTRARWGEHFPLRAGDEELAASEELTVHSPSHPDAEPVGHAALADAAGARRAVAVARSGAPRWARTPVAERAAILRRAAQLLEERGHEFAAWVVHEGGRDRADAWAEVEEAIDYLRYYAAEAEALFEGFGDRVAHRGVVAVIPPWNFSIAIPCGMTVAALACGNAAILKPAEQTPLIGQRLVALLHEAGVPRDALIALPGRGETAGAALAESSEVDMVAFTGSRAVGTYLHEAVAMADLTGPAEIKSLVAELGGKNAVLVFADADPDEVVEAVMASSFGHANQKCSAASRILVAEPIFEALRDRLVDAARSLRVRPADAPDTRINPIIDREAHKRLRRDADTARAECEVLLDTFDTPAGDLTAGPLIVQLPADRALEARTTTEELFGPIVALIPFRTAAEAYAVTNGTAYGLTAGVFSRSPLTIAEATRALQAGNVYVNRRTTGARVGVEPFGGMRMSGTGPKAGGLDYLWAFVRRTDVPPDDEAERAAAEAEAPSLPPPLDLPDRGWDAPLEQRLAAVESAAVLLGERGEHATADALLATAQAARRELGRPQRTVPAAGQRTELRYDTPRGLGLLCARGDDAPWWLAAALLAGNAVALFDSPGLVPVVEALHEAGVPDEALRGGAGDIEAMLGHARRPEIAFAATDGGPARARALYRLLGPTLPGQRSLKALLSTLDGPQAGEPGFLRRFAWPKVAAVRTLRHGADLELDAVAH